MESIGRYRVVRELGRGAMGVVYLAEDPAIGRLVAIKTINLDNLSEPHEIKALQDRLFREARSAGILSHPGIVTIYDIQHLGHIASIVMEFVEGVTVFDKMNQGALEPGEVLSMLEQTAAAIDYAHSKGVLHRDIKPANLMVTPSGKVKVADFGVARLDSQKTATSGMVLGTPSYMAPEQISNKPLSPATDQFSLAVVAFELLTGQKPFQADSISALLYNIVFQPPTPVRQLNPSVSPAVEVVLQKALAKEPGDRYGSCVEFIHALKNSCEARKTWRPTRTVRGSQVQAPPEIANLPAPKWEPPQPAAAPIAPPEPLTPPRREGMKALAGFAVGVLVVAGGFFVWSSLRKPDVPIPADPAPVATRAPVRRTPSPKSPETTPARKPAPASIPRSQPSTTPSEPEVVPVEIRTDPPGAKVSAKGQSCVTPCSLDLPKGEYYLSASLEGYKDTHRLIRVPDQLDISVQLDRPMGFVAVHGHTGSTIYLDGKPWKDKAPARLSLPAGTYTICLETPDGLRTPTQTFEITENKIIDIR
ncbi:MAG: protein kinase [Bryobacterales bacterium]|nr:protein kinase [Bryobacterales bacterium]